MILIVDENKFRQLEQLNARFLKEKPYHDFVVAVYESNRELLSRLSEVICLCVHDSFPDKSFSESLYEQALELGISTVKFSNGVSGIQFVENDGEINWNHIVRMNADSFYMNLRKFLDEFLSSGNIEVRLFHSLWGKERIKLLKYKLLIQLFTMNKEKILDQYFLLQNDNMHIINDLFSAIGASEQDASDLIYQIEDEELSVKEFRGVLKNLQ